MTAGAVQEGQIICDPGPCHPGPILEVARDMGLLPLLFFAAVAFVAGRRLSRADLLLPMLCMAVILVAFHIGFEGKWRFLRAISSSGDGGPSAARWLMEYRGQANYEYVVACLAFALVPFAAGFGLGVLKGRKLKRDQADKLEAGL